MKWGWAAVATLAHPRACGENWAVVVVMGAGSGSSPRMRGKPPSASDQERRGRLIPAHAGKTRYRRGGSYCGQAHPRACGENGLNTRFWGCLTGSSPRMRGKRAGAWDAAKNVGLIPAHAGKTHGRRIHQANRQAHPRACGENAELLEKLHVVEGSSPRMRGKRRGLIFSRAIQGLIPAHAGKTSETRTIIVNATGSSPRMRGKHLPKPVR